MHLHFLVTEGGVDEAGVFHKIPRIDSGRGPGLCPGVHFRRTRPWHISTGEWRAEGSSLDSLVRAKTKPEAERLGELIIADHSRSIIFRSS